MVQNVPTEEIPASFTLGNRGQSNGEYWQRSGALGDGWFDRRLASVVWAAVAVDGGHGSLSLGIAVELDEGSGAMSKPGRLLSFQCLVIREGKGTLDCSGIASSDPSYAALQLVAFNCVRSRVNKIRSMVRSREQTDLMKVLISTNMAPRAMWKTGGSGRRGADPFSHTHIHMLFVSPSLDKLCHPGMTMLVASFLSLATGLPVKRRTAFTGEIDYR